MEMLSDGWQLSHVAQQLEFVSDSAFIAFFDSIQARHRHVIHLKILFVNLFFILPGGQFSTLT